MPREGLSAPEIAEIAGISPSAARSRLSTARKSLEQALVRLAKSQAVLDSTSAGLDRWARELRER